MNRCLRLLTAVAALSIPLIGVPTLAQAQTGAQAETQVLYDGAQIRDFPTNALRGTLRVTMPPEITLDGKTDRLSPGARIRDQQNQLVLSAGLINQPLVVNYLRDNIGQVQQVWVLTRDEAALKRPNSPKSFWSSVLSFGETPAPVDDGKTPFNELPAYK